jgi:hypothetical protein
MMTERQAEVVRSVCRYGLTDGARRAYVTVSTAKNHMTAVARRLGFGGTADGKSGRVCYHVGCLDGQRRQDGL